MTVNAQGNVRVNELIIHVGVRWADCDAIVILDAFYATVFTNGELIRHLKIDHTRRYQPSGRRRGGPRQDRHLQS